MCQMCVGCVLDVCWTCVGRGLGVPCHPMSSTLSSSLSSSLRCSKPPTLGPKPRRKKRGGCNPATRGNTGANSAQGFAATFIQRHRGDRFEADVRTVIIRVHMEPSTSRHSRNVLGSVPPLVPPSLPELPGPPNPNYSRGYLTSVISVHWAPQVFQRSPGCPSAPKYRKAI